MKLQKMKITSKSIKNKTTFVATLILLSMWLILPSTLTNSYHLHLLFMVTIYACLSLSLNIAVEVAGLPNMAHATFFGIGAYTAALFALHFSTPFYITILLAGIVSLFFGLLIGVPTLRLKGFYLSLATLSFGQSIRAAEINWYSLTRGAMGLTDIPGAKIGNYTFVIRDYIYYTLALLALIYYVSYRLIKSKTGRAMFAVKSDDIVAKSLGINTTHYKILAFALSAFFAGMVGSIYAHRTMFVSPDSFTQNDSTAILCMVILGSGGSLLGPVIGAIVLQLIPEVLRFADNFRLIFVGLSMILGVLAKELHWGQKIKDAAQNVVLWFHRRLERFHS